MRPKKAKDYAYLFRKYEQVNEDIYSEETVNNYVDDDLINGAEQGFMLGYLNA